ncbi:MAG: hypothetical protein AABX38_07860 [Candidatus Micrarchaeota archaeon]|mgnify:CR=1 FL=1
MLIQKKVDIDSSKRADVDKLASKFPNIPKATIERVYAQEMAKLLEGAKVLNFISILAYSNSRNRLAQIEKTGMHDVRDEAISR